MMPNEKRRRVTGRVIDARSVFDPSTGMTTTPYTSATLADVEAEAAVIGAVLQQPELYAALGDTVQAADFWSLLHGYLWYAFGKLVDAGTPIDILTVAGVLDSEPKAPIKGDEALTLLAGLYGAPPNAEHAETYARRVRDASIKMRLLEASVEMQKRVFDKSTSSFMDVLIDECNQLLFDATEQHLGEAQTNAQAAIKAYWDALDKRMEEASMPSVATGWEKWDNPLIATGGLYPGTVTVIAGKEGTGKTTWMLSMMRNMLKRGKHVVLFSLEMGRNDEIMEVLMSQEAGIRKHFLRAGQLRQEQYSAFVRAAGEVGNWHLNVVDEFPDLTPRQLRRKLRYYLSRQPIDAVLIDGLWLMEWDNPKIERHRAVGHIVKELTQIAKGSLGAPFPIVITHQYKEEVGGKKIKAPNIYHLSESAGVRRNAQVIVGLWRDSLDGITQAHLLKDRPNGNQGHIGYFKFDRERTLYTEV